MKRGYMIQNKKGLSAIVTTLLIVLLVLVAVGIVWGVINKMITGGAESAELSAKCLTLNVRATAVTCDIAGLCDVAFERTGTTTDDIAGVKLVFRDSVNGLNSNALDPDVENIERLVGKAISDFDSTLTTPDSVEVTPYFEDASGIIQLCGQTTTFEF